ncbi:hypothetical protein KCP74_02495 [Salmonella enterica subsp. enterica]|nr:hypothetical protein KCP74_02495 [Salmonella enterica subsp. enterica]
MQDIDCQWVLPANHRLYGIDTKEAEWRKRWSLQCMGRCCHGKMFSQPGSLRSSTLSSFCRERRDFIGNPRKQKLLLVTDGETAAVRHFLSRRYIMLGNTPVQGKPVSPMQMWWSTWNSRRYRKRP